MSSLPGARPSFRARGPSYLATIALGHAAKHWYLAAFAVFLPLIEQEYALSALGIAAVVTVRQLGAGLPNFFVGYISDRLHRQRHLLLPASLLATAASMAAAGLLPWLWAVAIAFAMSGTAAALWHPPAISMLSARFVERRGVAIALHGAGSGAGEALGPLGVGFVLAVFLADEWRLYVLWSFGPAVLLVGLLLWMLSGAPPSQAPEAQRPTRMRDLFGLLRYPAYRTLAYAHFSRSFAHFGLLAFLPLYLADDLGMDSAGVGAHIALLTLLGIPAAPLFGYVSDRVGRRVPIVVAMAAIALGLGAMGIAGSGIPLVVALALTGVFLWSVQDVTNAAAMDSAPLGSMGTVVGFMFGASFIGGVLAPVVAGLLVSATGDRSSVFFLSAGVMVPVPFVMAFAPIRHQGLALDPLASA